MIICFRKICKFSCSVSVYFLLCFISYGQSSSFGFSQFGFPCSINGTKFRCSAGAYLGCVNDTCQCMPGYERIISQKSSIICSLSLQKDIIDTTVLSDKQRFFLMNETCPAGMYCNKRRICECPESQVEVNKKCYDVEYLNPLDNKTCEIGEVAKVCDPKKLAYCHKSKCVCFPSHYYNFTTKECIAWLKSPIYNKHGYKAMPGEYCTETDHCVDGLKCLSNFTCACPTGCKFVKKDAVCDCGKVRFESPSTVIWTGVFFSLLSIAFWVFLTRKTYKNLKTRTGVLDSQAIPIGPVQPTSYAQNTYTNTPEVCNAAKQDLPPPYSSVVKEDADFCPPFDKKFSVLQDSSAPPSIGFTSGSPNSLSDTLPYSLQPPSAPPSYK